MSTEQIVLNTSDEAASIKTVTGWIDRYGRFWGDYERIARYSGCTHVACSECGKPSVKRFAGRDKIELELTTQRDELLAALKTAKWMLERDYIDDQKMAVINKCNDVIAKAEGTET